FGLAGSPSQRVSEACTCIEVSPEAAFARADHVFSGISVSKTALGDGRTIPGVVEFVFAVTNVWKGAVEDTLRVRSGSDGGMCGQDFLLGGHYLVYAYSHEGNLSTSLCARNRLVDQALWDRFALAPPRSVVPAWPASKLSRDDLFERMNHGDPPISFAAC